MSAHVIMNLLNELEGGRDKMRGFAEHFTGLINSFVQGHECKTVIIYVTKIACIRDVPTQMSRFRH